MDQTLELSIWLGTAGLAAVSASILLWRTRRVLARTRQHAAGQDAPVPEVRLVPAALEESASSVSAS